MRTTPRIAQQLLQQDKDEITSTELVRKFGELAMGEAVCHDFGYGNRCKGCEYLYAVHCTDRDEEDMDVEEYNFAYVLWLEEEGWNAKDEDVLGLFYFSFY